MMSCIYLDHMGSLCPWQQLLNTMAGNSSISRGLRGRTSCTRYIRQGDGHGMPEKEEPAYLGIEAKEEADPPEH